MIDITSLDGVEKLAVTCLYYAQLRSDDPRYAQKKCTDMLTLVANRYGMTYAKAKTQRDAFDALFDNGRKGWTDRPLEKRSRYLYEIYMKYGNEPFEDLERAVQEIINEAGSETLSYFSIKTKDPDAVNKIQNRESHIEFDGLNVLQNSLKTGQIIFIVLGGDKPGWDTGLIGIGIISKEPYDVGYSGKNYKIRVDMKVLLDKAIKREDLIPYRDTYGTIGIGPITKWEPNQALSQVAEKNAIALMRAMLELCPGIEKDLCAIVDADMQKRIKGITKKMVEIEVPFGKTIKTSVEEALGGVFAEDGAETDESEAYLEIDLHTGFCCDKEFAYNRIVFGAPGTGKSYLLNQDCEYMMKHYGGDYERVTFHPDYMYSQFVGTYKPVSNKNEITYQFVPGPFMRVYVRALKNCREVNPTPHILLIEEINRARTAAVFGDVFQLLDRDEYGISIYDIEANEDIKAYLARELGGRPNHYARIRIPNNMFIWATMNSADQGVFPMDTAFKRRWSFDYIGINEKADHTVRKVTLGKGQYEKEVSWDCLRRAVNEKLAKEYKVNEDKLMGPFFLAQKVIETAGDGSGRIADRDAFIKSFKNKVIMYLYEDAAKQHRHHLFSGCGSSRYSAVCDAFDEKGIAVFGENFAAEYYETVMK